MPAVTRVVGYFPGQRLRLLEDLPAGVALEWAARRKPDFWWHLKLADGKPDKALIQQLIRRFEAIRALTVAIRFSDDPFATKEATERILGLYKNATASRLVLGPSDGDGRPIRHFAFFSSRFRQTLWPRVFNEVFSSKDDAKGLNLLAATQSANSE
jgi:predicted alpha/beta hydrolase